MQFIDDVYMDNYILFQKSNERIKIEAMIRGAHNNALNIATQMVHDEFNGNLEEALGNELFIKKMHNSVKESWETYRRGYKELENLEAREGYVAMFAYAKELDSIAAHLPQETRTLCHYPFSGTDFYWARIFRKSYFEDTAFDSKK
jgi:hypothetical protein